MVGVNVQAWPEIARRVKDAGHEIGNHSVYHSPYSAQALAAQIGPNQDIIYHELGVVPVANRAPGLTRGGAVLNACRIHGLHEDHTHKNTTDWMSNPRRSRSYLEAEFIRVLDNGLIALYHDGGSRRPTPDATPAMYDHALSRGYQFHTTTDLINLGQPLPGSFSYGQLTSNSETLCLEGDCVDSELTVTCNYDPTLEMRRYIDEMDYATYAQRMRVVGALADLELAKRSFTQE